MTAQLTGASLLLAGAALVLTWGLPRIPVRHRLARLVSYRPPRGQPASDHPRGGSPRLVSDRPRGGRLARLVADWPPRHRPDGAARQDLIEHGSGSDRPPGRGLAHLASVGGALGGVHQQGAGVDHRPPRRGPDPIRAAALLGGVGVAVVVGGWLGLGLAVPAAAGFDLLLRRLEPAEARRQRIREAADLPIAADLLAAVLRTGAPVDHAVGSVAHALGGPLGERLAQVGRLLQLGSEPAEAWLHLEAVAGAERMALAAVRSARSGAALAGALTRVADDLRADRAAAAEAAARRAGVLVVLPLGLCFLPAFILAGLVPVIVAVLGDVLVSA